MRTALAVITSVLISGCEQSPKGDDAICSQFPPRTKQPTSQTPYAGALICVTDWSIRLSRAEGSISEVAEAALGACHGAIDHYAGIGSNEERHPDPAQALAYFRREAMFRVAQARAGDCPIPK